MQPKDLVIWIIIYHYFDQLVKDVRNSSIESLEEFMNMFIQLKFSEFDVGRCILFGFSLASVMKPVWQSPRILK